MLIGYMRLSSDSDWRTIDLQCDAQSGEQKGCKSQKWRLVTRMFV